MQMRDATSSFFAECIRIVFVEKTFPHPRSRRKSMPMKKTNISQNSSSPKDKNKKQQDEEESFKITHVFEAIAALPRLLRLGVSTHSRCPIAMVLVAIM